MKTRSKFRLGLVLTGLCAIYPYFFVWAPWIGPIVNQYTTQPQDNDAYFAGVVFVPLALCALVVAFLVVIIVFSMLATVITKTWNWIME